MLNNAKKYLYITNEENNTDNRPIVATFEGLAVPQFPFKHSELPLLFAEVAKGGGANLATASDLITEAIEKQETYFLDVITNGDKENKLKLISYRYGNRKDKEAVLTELPKEAILMNKCITAFYNSCEGLSDDLENLYIPFRAEQVRKGGNESLADVIEQNKLYPHGQLLYLTEDNSRLLVIVDCFDEDINEDDEQSDFVCDITAPILQGLKEALGGLADNKSFADIVGEYSKEELEKLLAFVIWGYETNGEAIIIKKITTF